MKSATMLLLNVGMILVLCALGQAGDPIADFCVRKRNQNNLGVWECSPSFCSGYQCELNTVPFFPPLTQKSVGMFQVHGSSVKKIFNTTFPYYFQLKSLSLDDNNIKAFESGAFFGLFSLEYLSLRNNAILSIPDGLFRTMKNLFFLDLSGNALWGLTISPFSGLDKLRYFNIADNPIGPIQCGFFDSISNNLHYLNMSRAPSLCKIVQTPDPDTEIQCKCQYSSEFHRLSHCDQTGCPYAVRKITNIRQSAVAIDISSNWQWVGKSLQRWRYDYHETMYRGLVTDQDKVDKTQNSKTVGISGTGNVKTDVALTITLCVGVLALVGIGALLFRYRRRVTHVVRSLSSKSSTSASTMLDEKESDIAPQNELDVHNVHDAVSTTTSSEQQPTTESV